MALVQTSVRTRARVAAGLLAAALAVVPWLQAAPASAASSPTVAAPTAPAATVGADAAPGSQTGYWLGARDGGVYGFGTGSQGQLRGRPLAAPIVGITPTPDGGGYWLVASDGGVFSYGDARFYGSTGAVKLNQPIVGMASTQDGRGYWLVAADGGIFSFGDASFYGSTGGIRLNKPVVGMAAAPGGAGYWLVASDGGIFSFGTAPFHGSTGGVRLVEPIVGMAASPTGNGYWLVASDGGIFAFGDAPFDGSIGGHPLAQPIVGMAAAPSGGYWMVASDGGIFAFGDAPFRGSTGAAPGPAPVVGIAATGHGALYPAGQVGSDYSTPQCPGHPAAGYPAAGNPVAIVGVDGGLSDETNPCFAAEAANAGANLTVYINVDQDQPTAVQARSGPAGSCASSDLLCTGYNWGYNTATASVAYAHRQGYAPSLWWLDVEGPCGSGNQLWLCGSAGQASNAQVIQGAIDALHAQGLVAGIYSTDYQWTAITGGSIGHDAVTYPGLPIWIAWAPYGASQATQSYWASICTNPSYAFAGGTPWLVQWLGGDGSPTDPFDGDYACPV